MKTGTFSRNVSKLFSKLNLVTDNLLVCQYLILDLHFMNPQSTVLTKTCLYQVWLSLQYYLLRDSFLCILFPQCTEHVTETL